MIINVPTKYEFETLAKENLTQCFNLLFKVYDTTYEFLEFTEEVSEDEIWEHNKGTLRTALILLHQSIESLMKGEVCDTSPLLLLDKQKKDWPTLPNSEEKEFDSLYTIGAESLLNTFCAVSKNISVTQKLVEFIEEIRLKRNTAIHGTKVKNITPKFIILNTLKVFTYWFGKDSWFIELKKNLLNNPQFGYFDTDYEESISYKYLDFTNSVISKKDMSKHISFDINGRQYFCPSCKYKIDKEYGLLESKWAFLYPNKPTSTCIKCLNCNQNFDILREDCNYEDCKGNVMFNDEDNTGQMICLTCYEMEDT